MSAFCNLYLLFLTWIININFPFSSLTDSRIVDDKVCINADGSCESNDIDCEDKYRLCLFWAQLGECTNNKGFMSSNCPQSCELCTGGKVRDWNDQEKIEPDCKDMHPQCSFWASEGECVANPGYMLTSCKLSCNLCIDITTLRENGVDELEM
jgi:hypothetical protein